MLLDEIEFEEIMYTLEEENKVVLEAGLYYLVEYYDAEVAITDHLFQLSTNSTTPFYDFDHEIALLEEENKVYYNEDQRNAIKKALENKITIISGGPGTGKTTIINAIVKLYIKMHDFSPMEVLANIALLAPTGRASKKMSTSTGLPAMTIHRF